MLYRGTTPYHSFILPLSTDEISEIYVTYWQNGEIVLDFDKSGIELVDANDFDNNGWVIDENSGDEIPENDAEQEGEILPSSLAIVHLTQEDTLQFKFWPAAEKNIVAIQIRVLTTDGEAYASEVARERVYGVLKQGVIPEE